jgi:hypothetical protein
MANDMQVKIKITGDATGLQSAAQAGKAAIDDAFGQSGQSIQGRRTPCARSRGAQKARRARWATWAARRRAWRVPRKPCKT